MDILIFILFMIALGYIAFRAIAFLIGHLFATIYFIVALIVSIVVLANYDLLPKNPPQTTNIQQEHQI